MTQQELQQLLLNKYKKFSKKEIIAIFSDLKSNALNESKEHSKDANNHIEPAIYWYGFYIGESNAFQIVLDLMERLEEK